ncbi:uncharacterized protein LOC114528223 [Dendronephthya gigantea]|uniref:uncharacterized protein LOC114528223 n=1 Tax=Dendronephthya gigantea TaxID=151771 RepID=UPI00106D098D|nr:uncharacterized protein LOC114528223 [Dendronephthya gigantea]
MSTTFSNQRGTKYNAETYSKVNDWQLQYGKNLAKAAGIKHGKEILDMGCGTGELTSFLAASVGEEGLVVGVDPDVERIKTAIQNHSVKNLTFRHGDSSSQFIGLDKQYDIHFSNFVIQWLDAEEKEMFVQTAFKCLKPGGTIAIQSFEDEPEVFKAAKSLIRIDDNAAGSLLANTTSDKAEKVPFQHFVTKYVIEKLLQKSGFDIISSDYYHRTHIFSSADEFLAFLFASDYYDATKISSDKRKDFENKFVNVDGKVEVFSSSVYQIIARKKADLI